MKKLILFYTDKLNKIFSRNSKLNTLYSLQITLFNALISGDKSSDIYLPTLNSPPHMLRFERTNDGQLCFTTPADDARNFPPIFVITLPKSGTYLVEKILSTLKFQNAGFQADGDCCDTRLPCLQSNTNQRYIYYNIPGEVQISLVQPGQFVVGHIPISWQENLMSHIKLCCVRDLRYSIVSYMRYFQARSTFKHEVWSNLGYTEEALYQLMRSKTVQYMFEKCKEVIQWIKLYPDIILRFEDLTSKNFENTSSMQNICNILKVEPHEVLQAVQNSRNQNTITFSGQNASLDDVWSERVQREFAKHGGIKLNQQLGY